MAEDEVVSMVTTVAYVQNSEWEKYLKTYIEDRRPPEIVLSGGPAAEHVQPELDAFVKDVSGMFDDNLDLGMLLHKVMVGQRKLIVETDEKNAIAGQTGETGTDS